MRKNQNPDQGGPSDPRGDASEPSDQSKANYTQHLFERSHPEGLIDDSAAPDSFVEPTETEMPTLPDALFETLPDFLKKVVAKSDSNKERDILLLGALDTLSSCLYKIHGLYDQHIVYPNLFLFVAGKVSAGKGRLSLCRKLVVPIHDTLRKESKMMKRQYDMNLREYNMAKGKDSSLKMPVMTPEKLLLIPANNSATGVFQLLADNDGIGLIFETEADTMAQALKNDFGNYNDGLRKGFHHEKMSYFRRTDQEFREIEKPRFSVLMSGTIHQLTNLIPSAENGLFSRFMFYFMNTRLVWKNVLADDGGPTLDDDFDELGQEFLSFYEALNSHPDMMFHYTAHQRDQFNLYFSHLQKRYLVLQDMGFIATVRRLGLICFRMCMIFTALRIMETGDFSKHIDCLDVDFQASLSIVSILVKHASYVYSQLPDEEMPTTRKKDRKDVFLHQLSENFTRQSYLELADSLDIPEKTADRYVTKFCEEGLVERVQQGVYFNLVFREKRK